MKNKSEKRLKIEATINNFIETTKPQTQFTSADIIELSGDKIDPEMVRKILREHYNLGNIDKYDRNTWITIDRNEPLKQSEVTRTTKKTEGARGVIREFINNSTGGFSGLDVFAIDNINISIHTVRKILKEFEGLGVIEKDLTGRWQKKVLKIVSVWTLKMQFLLQQKQVKVWTTSWKPW